MNPPPKRARHGIDTKTRYQGVMARHKKDCAVERGERCRCNPSYYGVAYDRGTRRQVKTKRLTTAEAARNARADLLSQIQRGEATAVSAPRLAEART